MTPAQQISAVKSMRPGGESHIHAQVKHDIFAALNKHRDCSKCAMERVLKGVRPISVTPGGEVVRFFDDGVASIARFHWRRLHNNVQQ
jgi:hypothetical protein